jgi:anaphase-promoting complex subunit 3
MAMKGDLLEDARSSFQQALALNPMIWEAFEGLCSLGWWQRGMTQLTID